MAQDAQKMVNVLIKTQFKLRFQTKEREGAGGRERNITTRHKIKLRHQSFWHRKLRKRLKIKCCVFEPSQSLVDKEEEEETAHFHLLCVLIILF